MPSYGAALKQTVETGKRGVDFEQLKEYYALHGDSQAKAFFKALGVKASQKLNYVTAPARAVRIYNQQKQEEERRREQQQKIDVYSQTIATFGFSTEGSKKLARYLVTGEAPDTLNEQDERRALRYMGDGVKSRLLDRNQQI
jgi:hypothetical protein